MRRTAALVFLALAALGAALLLFKAPAPGSPSDSSAAVPHVAPAQARLDEETTASWPGDALVLNMTAGEAQAPFALRESVAAPGGALLDLPEGAGTKRHEGRARFKLRVPASGTYAAWVRAQWTDECGNSVDLQFDDRAAVLAGNDQIYRKWHWVPAGTHKLTAGTHTVTLAEREDGIAIEQLFFTKDIAFQPSGQYGALGAERDLREFRDDFARSPGHGLGSWDPSSGQWNIAFSFDPNRIPNQYSLTTQVSGAPARVWVRGPPWNGCSFEFSFTPVKPGCYGALLDRGAGDEHILRAGFTVGQDGSRLVIEGAGLKEQLDLGDAVRLGQWHRVSIERWAWILRISLDGRKVYESLDAEPQAGGVGLFADAGEAAFDDVAVTELRWRGEDGRHLRLPWKASDGARWSRSTDADGRGIFAGRAGSVAAPRGAVREFLIEESPGAAARCLVKADGLVKENPRPGLQLWRAGASGAEAVEVSLAAGECETQVRRVGIRYGTPQPAWCSLGGYTFASNTLPDPSDYLDFTPEEYRAMSQSDEAEKLRRQAKFAHVVGQGTGEYSAWVREQGQWAVREGMLWGSGPGAALRHTYDAAGDLEVRLKLRLLNADSAAEIELYGGRGGGVRVRAEAPGARRPETHKTDTPVRSSAQTTPDRRPDTPVRQTAPRAGQECPAYIRADGTLCLPVPVDGEWHELYVCTTGDQLFARVDKDAGSLAKIARGDGRRLALRVPLGRAQFDDVELRVRRADARGGYYAFDQRETDWWRTGGAWLDHGGITCILASNWISLLAPEGEGLLWSKRAFGPDVQVAFCLTESSEWHGWDKHESHTHHPFDNLRAVLAPEREAQSGYRLELNSQNRTATVLYRRDQEVARVAQGGSFPLRYVGGHAPYVPRRAAVVLTHHAGTLTAEINGREVLKYTDPEPLEVKYVGLGGYRTRVNLSHVEVRTLGRE